MITFKPTTKIDFIKLPDGTIIRKVSEEEYLLCEQIRNYVYRTHYETGISIEMASLKAQCLFGVNEKKVNRALKKWRSWFYGDGKRHRPIELFIKDNEERLAEENKVNIEIKQQQFS